MKRNRIFLALALLFTGLVSRAQVLPFETGYRSWGCDADYMGQRYEQAFPELKERAQRYQEWLKNNPLVPQKSALGNSAPTFIIPVVVHVAHNNGPERVSPATIQGAIDVLNRDYRKRNADSSLLHPTFAPLSKDAFIEFRLAQRDPVGNCTPGYVYETYANTGSAGDDVKVGTIWDRSKYLNIWVVNTIASGAGGYAYRPVNATQANDGILIVYSQFGASSSNFAERSLTHEVGHWLGLFHTWGPGNDPGVASNCGADDQITDTPNTIGVGDQSCNKNFTSCGGILANVENYMDYSTCGRMFTMGQIAVMQATLNNTSGQFPFRRNLWQPANHVATGIGGVFSCKPQLVYPAMANTPTMRDACAGNNITFSATVTANASDPTLVYTWRFVSGSTVLTFNGPSVTHNFPVPGRYSVTVKVQSSGGGDSVTYSNGLVVRPSPATLSAPNSWEFNATPFSQDETLIGSDWETRSTAATAFRHATLNDGRGVLELPLNLVTLGSTVYLTSPNIDMTPMAGKSPVWLYYRRAASRRNSSSNDQMVVRISTNCGTSFSVLRNHLSQPTTPMPINFYTTTANTSGAWQPAANDWVLDSVPMLNYRTAANAIIRFDITVGSITSGNRFYLDWVGIGTSQATAARLDLARVIGKLNIVPNPAHGPATVNIGMEHASQATLQVTDLLGRHIGSKDLGLLGAGDHSVDLGQVTPHLAKGIYLVRLQCGSQSKALRFVNQ